LVLAALPAGPAEEVVRDAGVVDFRADTAVDFRADTARFAPPFFAPPLRAVFRAVVLRLPCRDAADFRVDLPAERAPPRAVLRADDLDRLLDDALRLAMSVILVYLP
jgi:hypothetical protein